MAEPDDRDTVERFSNRAADYVRYRPTYPPEAVDAILDGLGPPGRLVAADVGAGTGISARLLGERGVRVIAVEPGEAMRRAAEPHPNVAWVAGRAEATGLASQAVGLVLCAQSFHWFRPAEALPEFARILKARRRLTIIWNRRSTSDPVHGRIPAGDYRCGRRDRSGDPGVRSEGDQRQRTLFIARTTKLPKLSAPRSHRTDRESEERILCPQERRRGRTTDQPASGVARAVCRCGRLRDCGVRH